MTGGVYLNRAMKAIEQTGDNHGASLQAIKKYLQENYEDKYDFKNDLAQKNHLKKILDKAIDDNVLYHPGHKATGKYKISPQSSPSKKRNPGNKKSSKRAPAKSPRKEN